MVKLEDAVIARLSTHGTEFEVLVDPDLTLDYRAGEDIDIRDVLAAEKIFKDSSKGKKASEEKMEEIFGTSDPLEVADKIIKDGDIQVTTRQRKEMRKKRKKELISLIARRAVDPQKEMPHPPRRIENALEKTNFQVDAFKSAREQMPDAVEALRPILPISFETRTIVAKVPPDYGGKAYRIVDDFAEIKEDKWLDDGSWAVKVEIPAGMQPEFFQKLNDLTHGEVETKVVKE
ncbi:RNA-associated protein [candidate division MSBL1 archaeon SCGC-AAA382A13]|uniref:RNA-associated protein n=1 Tax=candidate division MSBL1 archaeon SCGC-AAA382A13 TaxID=1698279 RepID=A0A133VFP4_9EURY|nr:RNA-associated protein [candidate division MSBL1 archaeon SCGC-AAA382A13]